ncbi:MAG: chitobiase/beta-hexosaminidase C-terminal domain-containing protein [Fibrobacterota bacterium]
MRFLLILSLLCAFANAAPPKSGPKVAYSAIDTFPPVITVIPVGGTYTQELSVSFKTNEAGTVYYTLDDSPVSENSTLFTGLLRVMTEGKTVVRFMAMDLVGNKSKEQRVEYFLDTRPPSLEITPPSGSFGGAVDVKLLVSKPSKIYYTLDNTVPTEKARVYASNLSVTATCTLKVMAVDGVGNRSRVEAAYYYIDRDIPVVTVEPEGGLFQKPIKVVLSSGPNVRILYSLDEFAPLTSYTLYTAPVPVKGGQTVFSFYGENQVGTRSDVVKKVYTVDMYPPKVTAMLRDVGDRRGITLRANEKAVMTYTLDGRTPDAHSTPYKGDMIFVPKTGVLVLRVYARDPAGNEIDAFVQKYSFDAVPPKVGAAPLPGTYNRPFSVTLSANEPCRILYTLDNTVPTETSPVYTAPIPLTMDSRVVVTFFAMDDAENKSELSSFTYYLDQTPPRVVPKIERLKEKDSLQVTLEMEPKACVYFTRDGLAPTPQSPRYEAPFMVKAGSVVKYLAVDSAGNGTGPVELTEVALPRVTASPQGGTFNTTLNVILTSSIPGKIYCRLDSRRVEKSDFTEYKAPLFLNANGLYRVAYYCEDNNGNRSSIIEQSYFIDMFAPEIKVYTRRHPADSTVTVYFDCSENTSIYYTLDGTNPFMSPTSRVIGNKYFLAKDKLVFKQNTDMKINFIGEDLAGNRSEMYQFDVNLPTVLATPVEGRYNEILKVTLTTYNEATIYFTLDGSTPTDQSTIYRQPIAVTRTTPLRYFAVDRYGFKGQVKGGSYEIDLPPRPDIKIESPPFIEGLPLTFDASASVDEESAPGALRYRWDFNGDGAWDTDFQEDPKAVRIFKTPGLLDVTLQVRDASGLIATLVRPLLVIKDCPPDMVPLAEGARAYCVDRYEYPNIKDSLPRTGLTWVEAAMVCRNSGKRLCTLSEWQAACSGPHRFDFPYGMVYDAAKCNTEGSGLSRAGRQPECQNGNGVFDLAGNAWEWVLDRGEGYNRVAGGNHRYAKNARCDAVFPNLLSAREESVGFRCCK